MAEKQKRSTKKVVCRVQLNQRESETLDEICKYSKLTKSDAIRRALKYYYDDYCPCNTEQKNIIDKANQKAEKLKNIQVCLKRQGIQGQKI